MCILYNNNITECITSVCTYYNSYSPYSCKIIFLDGINRYVNVTFDPNTRHFICLFLNQMTIAGTKRCNATVKYGTNCDQEIGMYSSSSTNNSVNTPQIQFINGVSKYCISVIANSDMNNLTVAVEGMLSLIDIGKSK